MILKKFSINMDNTTSTNNYGYSDFLREYLHCDEQDLIRARKSLGFVSKIKLENV